MSDPKFWKSEYSSDLIIENIYRQWAKKCVGWLSFLPISATWLTILRMPLGAYIIYLFSVNSGKTLLFAFMVLWKLMDKMDGAWAREKKQVSKLGAWTDIVVDRLFWGFLMLGVTIAVYRDVSNILPWVLLFLLLLGSILFQNFSFLGQGMGLIDAIETDVSSELSGFRKRKCLYQLIFSTYYLWDQVLALALLLYSPIRKLLGISTIFYWLVFYAVFFNLSFIYVLVVQYKKLKDK